MPLKITATKEIKGSKHHSAMRPGWQEAIFSGIIPHKGSDNKGMFFDIPEYLGDNGYAFSVSKTLFANSNWAVERWLVNALLKANGYKAILATEPLPPLPFYNEDEVKKLQKNHLMLRVIKNSRGYWEIVAAKPKHKSPPEQLIKYVYGYTFLILEVQYKREKLVASPFIYMRIKMKLINGIKKRLHKLLIRIIQLRFEFYINHRLQEIAMDEEDDQEQQEWASIL